MRPVWREERHMSDNHGTSVLFQQEGTPTPQELIPLALQHVVAAVVGIITPGIIVANTCGLSGDERTMLIQVALVMAGIVTLLQAFPLFGKLGSGLPIIMGASFAYVPTLVSIGGEFGIGAILGAELAGGVVSILFGLFLKQIRKLFPPVVTGTVVFCIGLSLYTVAIGYMAGGSGSENFGSVASAGWFELPRVVPFELMFVPSAIASLAIVFVVASVQAIGDFSGASMGGMDSEPTDEELSGGLISQGVVTMLGAFFGALPTSTYGQNVGIVTQTRVINRKVFAAAAIILALAGLMPKFAAVLSGIPQAVIGGATVNVFATITMTDIRILSQGGLTPRKSAIAGLSVALGMGIALTDGALAGPGMPAWISIVFGDSAVTIAALVAIVLNLVLPKGGPDQEVVEAVEGADEVVREGVSALYKGAARDMPAVDAVRADGEKPPAEK